jgi:TonB family protein
MTLRTSILLLVAMFAGTAAARVGAPPSVRECNEALEAAAKGDPAGAADLQERCIAKVGAKGPVAKLHVSLGYYRYLASQYAEAIAAFDRAIELDPAPNAALLAQRGRAKLELGLADAARADFEAASARDPKAEQGPFGMGLLHERGGNRDEARAAFLRAFNLGERSPEMLRRVREYGFTVPEMPVRRDPPRMTYAAFKRCKAARTMLSITIDELGLPVDVVVSESSGYDDLDGSAVEAARKWNLEPDQKDGSYVGRTVAVPVSFANPCGQPALIRTK